MGTLYPLRTFIIVIAFWVAECIAFPIFIKAQWPKKCPKSFVWKVIAASIFVGYGIFAYCSAKNAWGNKFLEVFARDMVIGLALGWLGDVLLHLTALSKKEKPSKAFQGGSFVSGLVAFLVGHIFYVIAYLEGIKAVGHWSRSTIITIVIEVVILLAAFVAVELFVAKIKLGVAAVPVALYAATISTMLVSAVTLAIYAAKYSVVMSIVLALGALLFVISDSTLVFCMFGSEKAKNSYKLKVVNLTTYFIGQMMLASAIFLCGSINLAPVTL
ncbi:MAG: lysoplasmalogenase [Ruminococcaceae bacterium]|nr:lysoplasmalogenase [Oscillospiraceae bacterium]